MQCRPAGLVPAGSVADDFRPLAVPEEAVPSGAAFSISHPTPRSGFQMSNQPRLCRLCARSPATLTDEHVPPKSTGNRDEVEVEYMTNDQLKPRQSARFRNGVALRVLCKDCNNRHGSRLGTGFSDFAKQVRESGKFETPGGGVFVSALQVFPSRVLRQLLLSFLCAQPYDNREGWYDIREFIRARSGPVPDSAPRVLLYYNRSMSYRLVPISSVGSLDGSRRTWAGSEISAPGLGVIFTVGSNPRSLERLIGTEPLDITKWGDLPFESRNSVVLRLPRLHVTGPHPLGFGSRRDIDKWRKKNMIAWGIPEKQYPEGPASTGIFWKAKGHY